MSRIHEALLKVQKQHGKETDVFDLENHPLAGPESPEALPGESSEAFPNLHENPSTPEANKESASSFSECAWAPDAARLVFMKAGLCVGIEEFRTLRSKLLRERSQRYLKTVLITGANPLEGKTFVCGNLGLAMSRHPGSRVLLIDADLRRSSLHSVFGMERTPGLSDYLSGAVDDLTIIRQTPEPQLCFVAAGKESAVPTELLHSRRMQHFIETVSREFDWIFIDSPPASVSDSTVLSDLCDGVIMVFAIGTRIHIAQKARKQIGGKILGVVLNRADEIPTYYEYYTATLQPAVKQNIGAL